MDSAYLLYSAVHSGAAVKAYYGKITFHTNIRLNRSIPASCWIWRCAHEFRYPKAAGGRSGRKYRQRAAEVIYGAGKTPEQIAGIVDTIRRNGQPRVLITRMSAEAAEFVSGTVALDYRKEAKVGIVGGFPEPDGIGKVVIATGGASDIPVAEEAALTAEILGSEVV